MLYRNKTLYIYICYMYTDYFCLHCICIINIYIYIYVYIYVYICMYFIIYNIIHDTVYWNSINYILDILYYGFKALM